MKAEKNILISIIILLIIICLSRIISNRIQIELIKNYYLYISLVIWVITISLLYLNEYSNLEKKQKLLQTEIMVKTTGYKEKYEIDTKKLNAEIEFIKNKLNSQEQFLNEEYTKKLNEFIEKNKNYQNISEEFKAYYQNSLKEYNLNILLENNYSEFKRISVELLKLVNTLNINYSDFIIGDYEINFIYNREAIDIYSNDIKFIEKFLIQNCEISIYTNDNNLQKIYQLLKINSIKNVNIYVIEQQFKIEFIITNYSELTILLFDAYLYLLNAELIKKIKNFYCIKKIVKNEEVDIEISRLNSKIPF